jgi:adenylate cyclase
VFGAPVALEDHAIRACLAALGVQEETKRLAVNVRERDDVDLQLRVGLNSGQVIAGEIGSGLSVTPPLVNKLALHSGWNRWLHRVE